MHRVKSVFAVLSWASAVPLAPFHRGWMKEKDKSMKRAFTFSFFDSPFYQTANKNIPKHRFFWLALFLLVLSLNFDLSFFIHNTEAPGSVFTGGPVVGL